MEYVYDLILVAIIVMMAVIGYKRGFLATVISLAKWVVSIALAVSLSGAAMNFVYDNFVKSSTEKIVAQAIEPYRKELELYENIDSEKSEVLKIIENIQKEYGMADSEQDEKEQKDSFEEIKTLVKGGMSYEEAICEVVAKPIEMDIIKPACVIAIFVVVFIVCTLLEKMLKVANAVPIVGSLNQTLGGALGVLYGLAICVIIVAVLVVVNGVTQNSISWLNSDIVEETLLFKNLAKISLPAIIRQCIMLI